MSSVSNSSSSTYISCSTSSSSTTDTNQSQELKNWNDRKVLLDTKNETSASAIFATATALRNQEQIDANRNFITSLWSFFSNKGVGMPTLSRQEEGCLTRMLSLRGLHYFPSFLDFCVHDLFFDFKRLTQPLTNQKILIDLLLKSLPQSFMQVFFFILKESKSKSPDALTKILDRETEKREPLPPKPLEEFIKNLNRIKQFIEKFLPGDESFIIKLNMIIKFLNARYSSILLTIHTPSFVLPSSNTLISVNPSDAFFHITPTTSSTSSGLYETLLIEMIDFHKIGMGKNLDKTFLDIFDTLIKMLEDSKKGSPPSILINYVANDILSMIDTIHMKREFNSKSIKPNQDDEINANFNLIFIVGIEEVYSATVGDKNFVEFILRIEKSIQSFIAFYEKTKNETTEMDNDFRNLLYDMLTKKEFNNFIPKIRVIINSFKKEYTDSEKMNKSLTAIRKISTVFNVDNAIAKFRLLHSKYSKEITALYYNPKKNKSILKIKKKFFERSTCILPLFLIFHDIEKIKKEDDREDSEEVLLPPELLDCLDLEILELDILPIELELDYNKNDENDEEEPAISSPSSSSSSSSSPSLPLTSSSLSSSSMPSTSSSSLPTTSGLLSSSSSSSPSLPLTSSSLSSSSVPPTSTPSLPPISGLLSSSSSSSPSLPLTSSSLSSSSVPPTSTPSLPPISGLLSSSSSSSPSLPLTSSSLSSSSVPPTSTPSLPPISGLLSSSSSSSLFPPSTSSSSSTTRPTPRTLQQASSSSSSSSSTSRADAIEKSRLLKILSKRRKLLKFFREERKLVASSKNDGSGHTSFSTIDGKKEGGAPNHGPGTKIRRKTLFKILKDTK